MWKYWRCIKVGVWIWQNYVGGIKNESGKRQISKAISVNDAEVELLKKLNEKGIELEVRMVPDDAKQNVMNLI